MNKPWTRILLLALACLFLVFVICPRADAGLWDDAAPVGSDWYWLHWFGYFSASGDTWIYHDDHGWMSATGSSTDSIWLWTTATGWLWTSETIYPHLYVHNEDSWVWYEPGSSSPRWFYDFTFKNWRSDPWVRRVRLPRVQTWAYNIQHVGTAAQRQELVGTHFGIRT